MHIMNLLAIYAILTTAVCAKYIDYTTVAGYFLQDNNSTNATTFDYVSRIASLEFYD